MAMFEIRVVVLFSFWYEPTTLYISPASMTFLPYSVDFDMTGGDDVWFARPQLFFTCSSCPTVRSHDRSSHREVSLVF
jgi:hypothetical protein